MEEAEVEEHEPILEDLSNGGTDLDDNEKGSKQGKDHCNDDNDDGEEEQEGMKLTEYHAKNYFNSTMGGKDLRVLFAMAIGCHSMDIPDHKDPPFCRSKTYHLEIKPDSSTLKLEVTRRWKAYKTSGRQPRPANWKIEKSLEYLMNNPIPSTEKVDREWLKAEIEEWKGIQEMINKSQQHEEDKVLHRTWSNDTPYLHLYHTLVDDSVRGAFGEAFAVKTREELDGRHSALYKTFYEKAADRFNDKEWIPNSLVLPNLHEDFKRSKPLPLNVTPITAEQFKEKLSDNRYKMVKVIADWERSGSGSGMSRNLLRGRTDDDDSIGNSENMQSEREVYEFWDGDDRKSFLRERPSHILYLWHVAYKYDILNAMRQQLRNEFTADGSSAPDVGSVRRRKSPPGSAEPSVITTGLSDNIQQIAASINGLVGVARQSQQTQEIQMLHIRQKELEDTIEYLEASSMEMEMKSCDETGTKKKLLGKALLKKKKDLKMRQNELAQTKQLIE